MFADAYMLAVAKGGGRVVINSCDPGLVYTDLILKMPRYAGKAREETGAQTPVCVSSYYCMCVLLLLRLCPHATACVLIQ